MRQPLSPTEYMFYHALSQEYPATLNELIARLKQKPYKRTLTVVYSAALASRLMAKGYVESVKISTGQVGQPASRFTPVVPLPEVVEAETERALKQLAFDERKTLLLIRRVVNEALDALKPQPPRSDAKPERVARKGAKKPRDRR